MSTHQNSKRVWIPVAVITAAGVAAISYAVAGGPKTGTAPAAPQAEAPAVTQQASQQAAQLRQHPADALPNKLIGLPVVASGGETVGQVLSYGPGGTGKTLAFKVSVVEELGPAGRTVLIPEDRTVVNERAIQLAISMDDVKKLMPNSSPSPDLGN